MMVLVVNGILAWPVFHSVQPRGSCGTVGVQDFVLTSRLVRWSLKVGRSPREAAPTQTQHGLVAVSGSC